MKKLFITLAVIILLAVGCNSSKNTKAPAPKNQTEQPATNDESNTPEDAILKPLNIQTINFPSSQNFNYFGVAFSVPWGTLTSKKEGQVATKLNFDNGKNVMILKKEEFPDQNLQKFLGNNAQEKQQIIKTLGQDNLNSSFSLAYLIYSLTPERINSLSGAEKESKEALLTIKKISLTSPNNNGKYSVYNFSTPNIKGFQFGEPIGKIKVIEFYKNDGNSFGLFITGSQDEVNFILLSIK